MATAYRLRTVDGKTFPMVFPSREAAEKHSAGTDLTVVERTIPEWSQRQAGA
ncbi:hypothetical protein QNA23_10620 [Rhodococcus erythropolis]|uniref:hypothetical protein n=1 Tax=Rhodococcus erythropolis TaxID=1833 RepID=UPI0024BB3131|nr:hypothetical protein [Rhodococcus erythropolis]MDJ0403935.1 hypothetical protein [Rhodococcus erythropolis]